MIEINKKDSYHITANKDGSDQELGAHPCNTCDLENVQHFLWATDYEENENDADAYLVHFITRDGKNPKMNLSKYISTFYTVRTVDPGEYLVIHEHPCTCEESEYILRNSVPWIHKDKNYIIHRLKG